jgi:hypothetical protein
MNIPIPPPWSTLRSIGNSPIVKLTIVIPVIGYLILFNQTLSQHLTLVHEIFGKHESPSSGTVSWRLIFLYLGLCAFAAGSGLFAIFCPRELKKYGSATEYIGGEIDHLSILELRQISNQLQTSPIAKRLKQHTDSLLERYSHFAGGAGQRDGEIEADGMTIYFRDLDKSTPAARAATTFFFILGACLTAVPTVEVFFRVSNIALQQVISLID